MLTYHGESRSGWLFNAARGVEVTLIECIREAVEESWGGVKAVQTGVFDWCSVKTARINGGLTTGPLPPSTSRLGVLCTPTQLNKLLALRYLLQS